MGGGLLQLVAYGAQDVYLTGNPQITFWKVSYRRYTNFSMETIEQSLTGTSTLPTTGTAKATCTISRNGDLIGKVYVTSNTLFIINGSKIINDVEIEIGGQRIDKHFNEWMSVWNELTTPASKALGLRILIGDLCNPLRQTNVMIPLQFWFCRNPGLALPLIALQYHEVKLNFTWNSKAEVGVAAKLKVFCDYIFLDTDERRRMAQNPHEYLIDQVQTKQCGNQSTSYELNFNHPVKELIWTGFYDADCNLKLNGQDRFAPQPKQYFQLRQPLDHHTSIPGMNIVSNLFRKNGFDVIPPQGIISAAYAPNTEIAANTFSVGKGGDGSNTLSGSNVVVTVAEAVTPGMLVYTIRLTSTNVLPIVGDTVIVQVIGNASPANNTTNITTIQATVTGVAVGGAPGVTNENNFSFQLNTLLTETPLTAAVITDLTIISMVVIRPANTCNLIQSDAINVYSFAIRPEEHQPSGTCNFSRIDSALLKFESAVTLNNIYAVNYNVLRIMSGMGGLAYSN